jgi:hypothetical protein
VDVHSFGITLWEIITKKAVFSHHRDYRVFAKSVIDGERPPLDELHPSLASFMGRCWSPNPDDRPSFEEITQIHDDVMLDLAVKDLTAKAFWKKQFPGHIKVNWKTFINSMHKEFSKQPPFLSIGAELPNKVLERDLQHSSPAQKKEYATRGYDQFRSVFSLNDFSLDDNDFFLTSLKLLFIPNHNSHEVKLEDFGNLIGLIGPFGPEMFDRVRDLINQQWFHGNISSSEAEAMLRNMEPGTYLVRTSANSQDHFVISSVSRPANSKRPVVNHRKVLHTPGTGFTFQNRVFLNFTELLSEFEKKLTLTDPCPDSIFQQLKTPINPYTND